jgi:hypothetical protein
MSVKPKKTCWPSQNPVGHLWTLTPDCDRWIKPYRPIAVVGSALRDRLLRDMQEANIWKFAMLLHKTMLVDPSGSNNKAMSCFCHFWIFSGNLRQHLKRRSRWHWARVCQGGRCTQVWHAWFMGFHTHMYFPPKSLKCILYTRSSNLKLNIRMSKKYNICKHTEKINETTGMAIL